MKLNKLSVVGLLLLIPFELLSIDGEKPNNNSQQTDGQKPNVIIIMTDDQGYGELSYHGNPILDTPNLDQLAKQSVELTDFHVAPMCTPSRGQLLTGMDAARNGALNVSSGRTLMRSELPTIADYFKHSGYTTGLFGKWHVGDNYPYRPQDRGFEETIWFPSSHINSVPDYWGNDYFDPVLRHNGKEEQFDGYSTDIFFEQAMAWMKEKAESDKPFFTYLPTNTPHQPFWAPEEDIEVLKEAYKNSKFSSAQTGESPEFLHTEDMQKNLIRYLAMIRNIDTNIGKLMDFLGDEGLSNNTILIFLNDNGSTFAPQYYKAGMRGMKTQLWEGGHRVSFFIRWPNGDLGNERKVNGLTTVQDVLPTLIDLTGIVPHTTTKFDGISLAPALQGATEVPEERMVVINYSRMPFGFDYRSPANPSIVRRNGAAVLWKHWRLLRGTELYNLEEDPMQQTNVIDQYPIVTQKMNDHLDQWWKEVKNDVNEPLAVSIGDEAENPTKLTAVEWLDVFVDLQRQVRNGVRKNGYWHLNVEQAGEYEFELRRWPREADLALSDPLPSDHVRKGDEFLVSGKALPISEAQIYISGDANKQEGGSIILNETKEVSSGEKAVTFSTNLEPGSIRLHTWFNNEDGGSITGAYYVYVKRK
ncbi:arylsulfatase [Halalkalibaculum sp. DA3122]|uniref:arylsulfatase n=1 Tax=Halalkalibaculum sp. DA3122 TaxID=3373607 RepID=UPI0037546772